MNKFAMVLGAAAAVTLAGCKDPDYKYVPTSQNDVKNVDTVEIESTPAPKCKCLPGTKHTSPCACGAADCMCIVETKPVIVVPETKPVTPKAVEPEYTIYVVQSGDYLAKISKKFNVTIAAIKRLNPSIKKDIVRVGQKLKIPGKVDVGSAAPAAVAPVAKKSVKKTVAPTSYNGATKEYVVKSGDTLGSIAYGNGINIRQLKELNGLTKDTVKVGQKLKIPAEKVVKAAKPVATKVEATAVKAETKATAKVETKVAETKAVAPAVDATAETAAAPTAEVKAEAPAAPVAEAKAEAPATTTYVVQEGDDMTGVSIRWGVSAAEIRELNNLSDGDQLVPGQIIKLPAEAQQ